MDVARDYRALRAYIMRRSGFIPTFMVGLKPDLRRRIGQMNFELRIAGCAGDAMWCNYWGVFIDDV